MNTIKLYFICFLSGIFLYSCQKEFSQENGGLGASATGTLKSTSSNDCLPSDVHGIYKVDSLLNSTNYIDVQVNVTAPGDYSIVSNTVNGFSFKATGIFNSTGLNTVRLLANGKPASAGASSFTIQFNGSSCVFDIMVISSATPDAVYNFNTDAGGGCSGATLAGAYTAGIALNSSDKAVIRVDVTTAGTYIIQTTTANGITFKSSGVFTSTGPQTVTLTASGTPVAAGNVNLTVSNGAGSTCTFSVSTVSGSTGAATYTLGGAGSNCTGVTLGGTYISGVTMTSANTAQIDVTVNSTGTYTITTDTKNNVSFSASGTFSQTGAQKVTLAASGKPASAGSQNFTVTAGTGTCIFPVIFSPAPSAATFTLSGAPGACTAAVINGNYTASVPLAAGNTIVIKANVTVAGTYTITSNTVNGITFSGSGTFASAGNGIDVTLSGSGTPAVSGTITLTPLAGSSSCSIDIPIAAAPTGIYNCTIGGVAYSFTDRAAAQNVDFSGVPDLYLDGYTDPPNGNTVPEFQIFINKNDGSPVGTGTYNVDGILLPNGYSIEIDYTVVNPDLSVTIWNTSSTLFSPNPPFTINVTSVSATRVKGTFSGTLTNTGEGSTKQINVTAGVFDLPL